MGGHNLLLWGPPGAGKTLLARQVTAWLPPLDYEEAVEVSRIHSLAGLLDDGLLRSRPFRAPHHTTSLAGLVGGGAFPRPGEVSLAHLGVLFLDELAEFHRPHLEALRQPLEDGRFVLGRAAGRVVLPRRGAARRRDEPLPVRLARGARRPLPLHAARRRALPRAHLGSASRPVRPRGPRERRRPRGPRAARRGGGGRRS